MKGWIAALTLVGAGCSTNGQLLFFTNTSIAFEVSSEPSTQAPRIIIGYKRQEGVLMPVFEEQERTTTAPEGKAPSTTVTKGRLRDEAFSVIAKYEGDLASGETARMSNAQWFATGPAAIHLSKAPGIAGMVTGSADIAEAAALEAAFLTSGNLSAAVKGSVLYTVFALLDADTSDEAKALKARVDRYAASYREVPFKTFALTGMAGSEVLDTRPPGPLAESGWRALQRHRSLILTSIRDLKRFIASATIMEAGKMVRPDEARMNELLGELTSLQERLDAMNKEMAAEPAIRDTFRYFIDLLRGK